MYAISTFDKGLYFLSSSSQLLSKILLGKRIFSGIFLLQFAFISNKIAKDLKKDNIFFAGIDFIDQKLNGDINVTSPTGLKNLYDLSEINIAKTFWKELRA